MPMTAYEEIQKEFGERGLEPHEVLGGFSIQRILDWQWQ